MDSSKYKRVIDYGDTSVTLQVICNETPNH